MFDDLQEHAAIVDLRLEALERAERKPREVLLKTFRTGPLTLGLWFAGFSALSLAAVIGIWAIPHALHQIGKRIAPSYDLRCESVRLLIPDRQPEQGLRCQNAEGFCYILGAQSCAALGAP